MDKLTAHYASCIIAHRGAAHLRVCATAQRIWVEQMEAAKKAKES